MIVSERGGSCFFFFCIYLYLLGFSLSLSGATVYNKLPIIHTYALDFIHSHNT